MKRKAICHLFSRGFVNRAICHLFNH